VDEAKFRLDLRSQRLWNGGQPVRLSNKAFQLLRLFIDNPDYLLTKDDILDGVWGQVYVTEGLVKEYVHDLRQALGDDPKQPQFIETVHGQGYRFLGGIEAVAPASSKDMRGNTRTRPPSLAVQPFTDLTGDDRWALFCRGLSEDLLIDLARYPDLMVTAIGPSSTAAATASRDGPDGNDPAADYLLNGSVQASGPLVRVNVKLVETHTGGHIWTDRYERELGEFFAIQSDIVGHVASAVGGFGGQIPLVERARLGRKQPSDLQVYELYLFGHELETRFEEEHALHGLELLQRAVQLDPGFARAWLVLAWIAWLIIQEKWTDDLEALRTLEREAFIKAASLDPRDPFALMELALMRGSGGDSAGASDALERALDLGKNQADLLIVASRPVATTLDDPKRAVEIMDKGLQFHTNVSVWHNLTIARVSYFAKDFDRAVRHARLVPASSSSMTRLFEVLALAQLGHTKELGELSRSFRARYPKFDPHDFMRDHPITAPGAQQLFLEGIEKAGI